MRKVAVLLTVPVVIGLGVWGYLSGPTNAAPTYRAQPVERGNLVATVSSTGTVNAVVSVQVGSQVSGQVAELLADFDTRVKKGQVIARLDQRAFQAKVDQAQADLASARAAVLGQEAQLVRTRADLENARAAAAEVKAQAVKAKVVVDDTRRTLGRQEELLKRELIAAADRDQAQMTADSAVADLEAAQSRAGAAGGTIQAAEAQIRAQQAALDGAKAVVRQKEAALTQAQLDLDRTVITAPVDGVVVSRAVDVGQTVAASLQAPVLFTIAQDLTRMQVEAAVDEADIGKIKVGGPARFTVDAFPSTGFTGQVAQVRKAALVNQNVVTYTVVVAVANPEGQLLPGMTANVSFAVSEQANVLKVPNAALRFRPPATASARAAGDSARAAGDGARASGGAAGRPGAEGRVRDANRAQVWVVGKDGQPARVPVVTGLSDGASTAIVSGDLTEGQPVIVGLAGAAGASRQPAAGGTSGGPRLRL